ncbi:hypothetical protein J2J97_32060 (plasmid) [Rhizobium bangladeshense]|uniref:hypothetical protein n=1 Tax=Rhizobium bangladeshense TaxID=1138189 RepID=UPI001A984C07|nr:hypothetical protein [Rhizobium bangladeshense]QSY98542.1 hypothetical protein J2J97_32060 [Rhizobium bangladeshense]
MANIGSNDKLIEWVRKSERMCAVAEAYGEKRSAQIINHALVQYADHDHKGFLHALSRMKRTPWTIDEFLHSKEFLASDTENSLMDIWPALKDDIRLLNPDVMAGEKPVGQALLGGATGTGKSVTAIVTTLNQALLMSCFKEPQRLFKLSITTQAMFLLMSVSLTVTKRAIYTPLRQIFTNMPYVRKWVPYDKYKESEISMDGNVVIAPVLASLQAMVGQAVAGGAIDEINFFSIVENSKMTMGPNGQGGRWDQAEEVETTLARRKKGRFPTTLGMSFGVLVVSSSTRYEGDYLDRRIDQVREFEEEGVVWLRHKQYEVQPQEKYRQHEPIRVLVGTDTYPTRILKGLREGDEGYERAGIDYPENGQVEIVPGLYKPDFQKDPENALRDIIGIATKAIKPFISQRHKIIDAILAGQEAGMRPFVLKQNVDLAEDGMPQIDEDALPDDLDVPRAVHVDLSKTKDRCGIAMVKIVDWKDTLTTDSRGNEIVTTLPVYAVEMAVSIKPHVMKPLDIADVRTWITQLARFWGFNIDSVTYDGFQSAESINLLRKQGVRAELISMDTTPEPYEYLRRTLYEDRMLMIDNDILRTELVSLEWTKEMQKIDHPPKGSKDISDAVAGAVYALSQKRRTRSQVQVSQGEHRERVRVRRSLEERPEGSKRPSGKVSRR